MKMISHMARKLHQEIANYLRISELDLSNVASALSKQESGKTNADGKLQIWLLHSDDGLPLCSEALVTKAIRKIKNPEIILLSESAFRGALEVERDTYSANAIILAHTVGLVQSMFDERVSKANKAAVGGNAKRAAGFETEKVVIAIWEAEIDSKMSADKAAEEIIGRVQLSHRKIADIIRRAKKMRDAMQNAQDTK